MRFTIFGSTGFVGAALKRLLASQGHEVLTPDRTWIANGRAKRFRSPPFSDDLGHVIYCIGLTADFRNRQHETIEAHVSLLNELLEELRYESFLYLSSTRVYQHGAETSEAANLQVNPLNSGDLYNLSKLTGESACLARKGQTVRVARMSNVIGFDASSQNFVNDVIRSAITHSAVTLSESLDSEKNYIHVDNAAQALINIATRGRHRIYNVAGPSNITHEQILRVVERETGATIASSSDPKKHALASIDICRYTEEFGPVPDDVLTRLPEVISEYKLFLSALKPTTRGQTVIDEREATVSFRNPDSGRVISLPMESAEAWDIASKAWLRVGWDAKHVYSFTWLGRPVIQLPEDLLRIQEVIYGVKPDVLIETGVAHGGSLIFYASLFEAMGRGQVIGIDIEIRPHNRSAIEQHPMAKRITLVEGSSVDPATLARVTALIKPGETVMLVLDSNHSRNHVLEELRAYAPLVSIGSYAVAADGIMAQVAGGPRTGPDWSWNNPREAARTFAAENPNFVIEEPGFLFNEGTVRRAVTYFPDGYLRRVR
jgi:cephalosporin hydroxylase/nucleoside-diphosphate-sugar epimerase